MKQALTIAVIAIAAFLLGTLMPRSPSPEPERIVEYRDTSYSRLNIGTVFKLETPKVSRVPSVLSIPEAEVKIEYRDSIRYVVLDREHKFLDNPDVRIWYSGVDPTIDSLQVKRQTVIQTEPWKRHSVGVSADIAFNLLGVGAEYEYSPFKWFSINASAGYDFYMKQPYAMAGAKIILYRW